jgi:hypothetical protein
MVVRNDYVRMLQADAEDLYYRQEIYPDVRLLQKKNLNNDVIFPNNSITFSCFKCVKSCYFISFNRLCKIAKQKIRLIYIVCPTI